MKKKALLISVLLFSCAGYAQEKKDDFSSFLQEELKDFDKFMDDANRDFINFMRDPWKQFDAEKPVQKRTKPEPVKPIVYDEKTAPKNPKPVCLSIEEILDLTTTEGKQKPVVKVNDGEDISFDEPVVIVKKKPGVIIVEEQPVAKQPVTEPEKKPVVEVEPAGQTPVKTPVEPVVTPVVVDEPDKQPAANPQGELYDGGTGRMQITFAGHTYHVSDALQGRCSLRSLKENDVADAYEAMCSTGYKALLKDCRQIASDLSLNDWGVFTLLRTVADACCADEDASVVMQQFLLNEMGYKAKMARRADKNQMLLFVATDCTIYGHPYTKQDGLTYYNINGTEACPFYMCTASSPHARNRLDMQLQSAPALTGHTARSLHQAKGSSASVSVSVSRELMAFYKEYPQCDYSVYVNAPVTRSVEQTLLSSLAPLVQGKSQAEAANLLINFVQTAFEYATDGEQFGYEKPFFLEELFYYPYCDCEDRSFLYSYLVKKLLGLDVVLLDYPNHIATAVRFTEQVGGDYLMVGGQKYTVCDPTYIGASIGMTMPQYKTVAAKVLRY